MNFDKNIDWMFYDVESTELSYKLRKYEYLSLF